jgi:AraC-like DNA-binding protein
MRCDATLRAFSRPFAFLVQSFMDPLSEVLSLLKPSSYSAGGFGTQGDVAIRWPRHDGIKCYALLAGECWLVVEGAGDPVGLRAGDCFLLPRGRPFRLTTDLTLTPVDFQILRDRGRAGGLTKDARGAARFLAGGHFALAGSHARLVLDALPPIVHIRAEADRAQMRWALERMQEELSAPRPGGSLIAQQLAYMMLVQALRLHLADGAQGASWLAALTDPQLHGSIAAMHDQPGHPWTLEKLARRAGMSRTVFALRFKEVVGETATEYLTRWRMLLAAERLAAGGEPVAMIASTLGYESESSFGKAFRRVIGHPPRRFARGPARSPAAG